MVMRGGGRSREIQSLQAKAAQAGGEGTARQQQRLEYLRNHPQAGRRPQGPQTGGPLQQAMGPGGQDAMRTQQPWTGGASNGGTTWDGQAPMNPYGGGRTMQPGSDPGFPGGEKSTFRNFGNQADLDAYRAQRGEMLQDSNYKDGIAGQLQQMQGQAQPMQRPTPGNMPGQAQSGNLQIDPNKENDFRNGLGQTMGPHPGSSWTPAGSPPMQRPTPGGSPAGNDPGFQKQLPPGALSRYQPGPNYFQGEGMGADRFSKFGSPPPAQQPVQGDWFRGGGMDNSRFARPGTQPAFQPPVQGNQVRGGGSPGLSRRRVNTNPNRGQPAGVLAPIPR